MQAVAERSDVAPPPPRLTEKEQRLIDVIVQAASRGASLSREQAGMGAGYGRGEVARVQASRALKRPHVRAALMEALRDEAKVDVANSLGVLRHLERRGKSERVRLDAALAGLRVAGLDMQQAGGPGGPAVVLNLLMDPRHVTVLAQAAEQARQGVVLEGDPAPAHNLAQVGGQDGDPSPGGQAPRRQRGQGGSKPRAKSPPGVTSTTTPPKSRRGAR